MKMIHIETETENSNDFVSAFRVLQSYVHDSLHVELGICINTRMYIYIYIPPMYHIQATQAKCFEQMSMK